MRKGIWFGNISSINYEKGCADVTFPGKEEDIKTDLPFMASEYLMPKIGDMVVVIFHDTQGVILGRVYNDDCMPEVSGKGVFYKKLSDKAYIKYDPATETLEIKAPKVTIVQE